MKILFIAPRYHTNQVQVVKALQDDGHEVYFHVLLKGPTEDYTLIEPLLIEQSKISLILEKLFGEGGVNKPLAFPPLIKYWKIFSNLKPNIVIIRNPYRNFSKLTAFYALVSGTKIIFYTQEELFRKRTIKSRFKKELYLWLFHAAWMTPKLGETKYTKLKNMYYVPLPVETAGNCSINKNPRDEELKILSTGKFNQERKKHLLLLKSIYKLKDKQNIKATIIGECATEEQRIKFKEIERKIKKMGLYNFVKLKNDVPYFEMNKYYRSHDLFILPAINEPYSISVTEALGLGIPVICTDTCGTKYHIKNGYNGFVIKSNSIDDLVIVLEKLLSNKKLINEMSKNSSIYAKNFLSRNVFLKHFKEMMFHRFRITL